MIHILEDGKPLCGFADFPGDWPPGHVWVRRDNTEITEAIATATRNSEPLCEKCFALPARTSSRIVSVARAAFSAGFRSGSGLPANDRVSDVPSPTIIAAFAAWWNAAAGFEEVDPTTGLTSHG